MRLRRSGHIFRCFVISLKGVADLAKFTQRMSKATPGLTKVRAKRGRGTKLCQRFGVTPIVLQQVSEVVARYGIARVTRNCLPVFRFRLISSAEAVECSSNVGMVSRGVACTASQQPQRFFIASCLVSNVAERAHGGS